MATGAAARQRSDGSTCGPRSCEDALPPPRPRRPLLTRIRYAALLLAALLALAAGLWPSILTLGALVALPTAVVALVGVVAPDVVGRRRWLRRTATAGGAFIVVELVVVTGWLVWDRRRPVVLAVRPPLPARVRIVYDVEDGVARRWPAWARRYDVPASGVVHTRDAPDHGSYSPDDPHPLRVVVWHGARARDTAVGAWVAGGRTRSGACTLAYDEFALARSALGDTVATDGGRRVGWLDSLDTWGVECRGRRLRRAPAGMRPRLVRTDAACYYDRAGGLGCAGFARP